MVFSKGNSQGLVNYIIGICRSFFNYLNKSSVYKSLGLLFRKEINFKYQPSEQRHLIDFTKNGWNVETVEMYSHYIHDDLVSIRQNYAESCKRLEQTVAIDGVILTILATLSLVRNPIFLSSFLLITFSVVFSTICIIRPISVEDSYRTPDPDLINVVDKKQSALQEMINTDIRLISSNSAANDYKRDIQKVSGFLLLLGLIMLTVSVIYVTFSNSP